MGTAKGKVIHRSIHPLARNIENMKSEYPLSESGRFGSKGSGKARQIVDANPSAKSIDFFKKITGLKNLPEPISKTLPDGKVVEQIEVMLSDRSSITWRSSTRDNSPAVSVRRTDPELSYVAEYQNIHFIKG